MTGDAQERWTRRILGGLGARPVGHADDSDGDGEGGPQVPVTPPAPVPAPTVPKHKGRIPDWWRTERPEIGAPENGVNPDDDGGDGDEVEEQDADDVEDVEDQDDEMKPATTRPVPTGQVRKTAVGGETRGHRKTSVRKGVDAAKDDPRLKWVAFTGSAAAVGKSLGLVDVFGAYLPVAEHAAVGTFALVLAAASAWITWKIGGKHAVQHILPWAPISRVILALFAAELGRRLAPLPVAYLNAYGTEWGLGPSAISLLITAGGICFALWWWIDRPLRRRGVHWCVRWMFRVPLASAVAAAAVYGSAPLT